MNTPVLFLIFNRPDLTEKVFSVIRQVQPKQLFIAADGPREDKLGEAVLCAETRKIVMNMINWDCEVHTLFREKNLGCKIAVSAAITWFFESVEEGIILEDDCLPSKTFFSFCEKLLNEYKDFDSVKHIGGSCFLNFTPNESFYFTIYTHIWGWATWKRAWKDYDVNIEHWPLYKGKNEFKKIFNSKKEYLFWASNFDSVYSKIFDTWDFQWLFTAIKNNGLSIAPSKNLIKNIGFRYDATHVIDPNSSVANLEIFDFDTEYLNYPCSIEINKRADQYIHDYYFGLKKKNPLKIVKDFCGSVLNRIKKLAKNSY